MPIMASPTDRCQLQQTSEARRKPAGLRLPTKALVNHEGLSYFRFMLKKAEAQQQELDWGELSDP
jgi:hypothetical protein